MDPITLTLASLVLFSVVMLIIIRWFLNNIKTTISQQNKQSANKQIINLRLQAIERLTLFLERISPESIIVREQQKNMNNQNFHANLLRSIRKEYEHNLAIQIYVSDDTWSAVKTAKEEIIKLINTCASEVSPQNPSLELGQKIIERSGGPAKFQINTAIKKIRLELRDFE